MKLGKVHVISVTFLPWYGQWPSIDSLTPIEPFLPYSQCSCPIQSPSPCIPSAALYDISSFFSFFPLLFKLQIYIYTAPYINRLGFGPIVGTSSMKNSDKIIDGQTFDEAVGVVSSPRFTKLSSLSSRAPVQASTIPGLLRSNTSQFPLTRAGLTNRGGKPLWYTIHWRRKPGTQCQVPKSVVEG